MRACGALLIQRAFLDLAECSSRIDGQEKMFFEFKIRKMVAYEPRQQATIVKLIPDIWLRGDAGDVDIKCITQGFDSYPLAIAIRSGTIIPTRHRA